jgi:hypothetical protein
VAAPPSVDGIVSAAPRLLRTAQRLYHPLLVWLWRIAQPERRPLILAGAFFVGLPALVVMAQLQSLLAAMHLPGEAAFNLTDLAFPHGRADAVIETWLAHSRETTDKFSGPVLVTAVFVAVDTLAFVPFYAIVLSIVAAFIFDRLGPSAGRGPNWAYRTLSAGSFCAVPVLVAFDLVENVTTLVLVAAKGDAPSPLDWILTFAWVAKWLLAAMIVIPLIVAAIVLVGRTRAGSVDLVWTAVALRVPIVVVAVFGLFLFGPVAAPQNDDVIRRWLSDGNALPVAGLVTCVLAAVIVSISWRLLIVTPKGTPRVLPLAVPFVGGLGLLALTVVLRLAGAGGMGFLALGLVLLGIAALSYPIRGLQAAAPTLPKKVWDGAPALLASLPLTLLGLAAVRASVFELVYARNKEYALLVVIGLLFQALGWSAYIAAVRRFPTEEHLRRNAWPLWVAAALVAISAVAVWIDPVQTGDFFGTISVLGVFLIGTALFGYFVLTFERSWLAPQFFLFFGLRRFPVFLILIAWALGAAALDPGGYHNARTIDRTGAAHPVTLSGAWNSWLARQPAQPAVPLVFVAAEGGGIRAAYWTARVLDCTMRADLDSCGYEPRGGPGQPRSIFAASGVSGGSLGLVSYVAAVRRNEQGNWPNDRLGEDFIAPTGAWMLFADLPNSLFKLDFRPDRAGVLEEAWEDAWGSPSPLAEGLFATWATDSRVPLLLLNGTSVQDGCRLNGSILDADVEEAPRGKALRARDCLSMDAFGPGSTGNSSTASLAATHDLVDLLCADQDVRLSTAALLSARFPWVSPAGRIPRCGTSFAVFSVDGGYFDTSAASTIQELWSHLEPLVAEHNASGATPCVVPVLLQLDNHYKEPRNSGASGRPSEAAVPLRTVRAARDARENDARQAAALLFSERRAASVAASVDGVPLVRFAHLFPRAHPGTSAPLGWALSQASMDDLTEQLREPANQEELREIRRWFSPDLACAR